MINISKLKLKIDKKYWVTVAYSCYPVNCKKMLGFCRYTVATDIALKLPIKLPTAPLSKSYHLVVN